MRISNFRMVATFLALGVLALSSTIYSPAWSQTDKVDPAATQILKK